MQRKTRTRPLHIAFELAINTYVIRCTSYNGQCFEELYLIFRKNNIEVRGVSMGYTIFSVLFFFNQNSFNHYFFKIFISFSFATRAGSPQQRQPITVGPYNLMARSTFLCGGKPEYPEKTHDFRQSVDYTLFT